MLGLEGDAPLVRILEHHVDDDEIAGRHRFPGEAIAGLALDAAVEVPVVEHARADERVAFDLFPWLAGLWSDLEQRTGSAIRLAGAVPIIAGSESNCTTANIAHALAAERTACPLLVSSRLTRGTAVDLAAAVATVQALGVPAIIDGAAQDMRLDDLLATGADLVLVSAQKYLAAPTAGLIVAIARRESRSWFLAGVSGCLYLAGYRIAGGWYELARVDALFVALALAGTAAARWTIMRIRPGDRTESASDRGKDDAAKNGICSMRRRDSSTERFC